MAIPDKSPRRGIALCALRMAFDKMSLLNLVEPHSGRVLNHIFQWSIFGGGISCAMRGVNGFNNCDRPNNRGPRKIRGTTSYSMNACGSRR